MKGSPTQSSMCVLSGVCYVCVIYFFLGEPPPKQAFKKEPVKILGQCLKGYSWKAFELLIIHETDWMSHPFKCLWIDMDVLATSCEFPSKLAPFDRQDIVFFLNA